MSFDGLFIHNLIKELKPQLETGKLTKIYQPFDQDLVLVFRKERKKKQLLVSANAQYPRFYLTDQFIDNPSVAPTFAMVLRKYLEGAILKDISQVGIDRIVNFDFTNHDELGDEQTLTLSFELMGRHSNVILIDRTNNKIIDLLKRINPDENRARLLLPKANYELPPLNTQLDLFKITEQEFNGFDSSLEIVENIGGLDRDNRTELKLRLDNDLAYATMTDFVNQATTSAPISALNNRQKSVFFTYRPQFIELTQVKEFADLNSLVEDFYLQTARHDWVKQRSQKIMTVVNNELKKSRKKIIKLENQLSSAENSEDYRIKGELLNAYSHQVKTGMKEVSLPNYYDEDRPLKIYIQEELSPTRNAQKYFTKYQKLRNSIKFVNEQLELAKANVEYFDSVKTSVDNAEPEDIAAIIEELENQGYLKKQAQKKRASKLNEKQLSHFETSSGAEVLVGKNNYQNDWLTFKKAQRNDLWFHVKNIPGSHVLLRTDEPTQQDIIETAEIAAYYSKAKLSGHVQVDYVEAKRVKKPNGAKPGFVIYTGQNSLEVTPDETKILALTTQPI